MTGSAKTRTARLICSCVIGVYTLAGQVEPKLPQIKRLYVEPFTIKEQGSDNLRHNIERQLRKLRSVTLVSNQAAADAVLTGKGEVWIKGYQSLNPRSGRLPSNGTPIYAAFLSVELKDRVGDTLWSYLVAPRDSTDISNELSKQVAKHLAEALEGSNSSSASHH